MTNEELTNIINLDINIDGNSSKYTIEYVNLSISKDYKTNNTITLYTKTNYNENIPINTVTLLLTKNTYKECLTTALCKTEANISINISFHAADIFHKKSI